MENDQTEQVAFDTLAKIIEFYRRELEETVTAADVLGYDLNSKRVLEQAA